MPHRTDDPPAEAELPSSNKCRIVVGRLLEIDLPGGYRTEADVEAMIGQLRTVLAQTDATVRPVIVADWRACKVLTPAVSARAVEMMTGVNARIERSAILHAADCSTSVLQLMRLVKEAHVPYRRVFTESHQLREWVGEILNEQENERLREFLMTPRSAR